MELKTVDTVHASDCAVHNAPAEAPGECDCGASEARDTPTPTDALRAALLHHEITEERIVEHVEHLALEYAGLLRSDPGAFDIERLNGLARAINSLNRAFWIIREVATLA